jgi:hypothetical protein
MFSVPQQHQLHAGKHRFDRLHVPARVFRDGKRSTVHCLPGRTLQKLLRDRIVHPVPGWHDHFPGPGKPGLPVQERVNRAGSRAVLVRPGILPVYIPNGSLQSVPEVCDLATSRQIADRMHVRVPV